MRAWLKRWGWPVGKIVLGLAIVVAIGRSLYRDLEKIDFSSVSLDFGWMIACGALYALALGCSAYFWYRVLWVLDQRPPLLRSFKAYYVGLLGKYLPGKAWALLMRGGLIKGPQVDLGISIIAAFYEVFMTMASGALAAALVFAWQPTAPSDLPLHPALLGGLIAAGLGVLVLPLVFNRLVGRLARRFQNVESFRVPPLRIDIVLVGLAIMACAWVFFGLSVWSSVRAVADFRESLTPSVLARYGGMMGLAYAGGFLVVFVPSGLGIREFILTSFLVPDLMAQGRGQSEAEGLAALIVLVLRVVWTVTEGMAAVISLSLVRGGPAGTGPSSSPTRLSPGPEGR